MAQQISFTCKPAYLAPHARVATLTRALRDVAVLDDPLVRARAYAAAGVTAWSGDEDRQACRLSAIGRAIARRCDTDDPTAPATQPSFADLIAPMAMVPA